MAMSLPASGRPRISRTVARALRIVPTPFQLGLTEDPNAIMRISMLKLQQLQSSASRGQGPKLLRNLLLAGVLNRAITLVSRAAPPAEVLPTTVNAPAVSDAVAGSSVSTATASSDASVVQNPAEAQAPFIPPAIPEPPTTPPPQCLPNGFVNGAVGSQQVFTTPNVPHRDGSTCFASYSSSSSLSVSSCTPSVAFSSPSHVPCYSSVSSPQNFNHPSCQGQQVSSSSLPVSTASACVSGEAGQNTDSGLFINGDPLHSDHSTCGTSLGSASSSSSEEDESAETGGERLSRRSSADSGVCVDASLAENNGENLSVPEADVQRVGMELEITTAGWSPVQNVISEIAQEGEVRTPPPTTTMTAACAVGKNSEEEDGGNNCTSSESSPPSNGSEPNVSAECLAGAVQRRKRSREDSAMEEDFADSEGSEDDDDCPVFKKVFSGVSSV